VHLLFATAVVTQLVTSLVMHPPRPGQDATDSLFRIHEYSGLVALALAEIFWVWIVVRRVGTDFGALVPWFSRKRLRALRTDTNALARALRERRWPLDAANPLASAIHGLGLLLISLMAATGGIVFYDSMISGGGQSNLGIIAIEIHKLLTNFTWAYLIGHAGIAVLHEASGAPVIAEMWSLRREPPGNSRRS
jgi:cytochrome b561